MGERSRLSARPHCGVIDNSTALKGSKVSLWRVPTQRLPRQFTVTVNTVFERSKIPLSKGLAALFLMVASKKGERRVRSPSSPQLGISYKSTWFMMHGLREAMPEGSLTPLGGNGGRGTR